MKSCQSLYTPVIVPFLLGAATICLTIGLTTSNLRGEAELVAWWPLDNVVGETTPDQSGNGYHMQLNNMDAANIVAGMRGGAMAFDGSTELLTYVAEAGQDLPISQHPSYSIALWVKGAFDGQVGGGDRRVFSEGSDLSNDPLLNIGTHNGAADATVDIFLRNGGSPGHEHSFAEAFDGDWHHIVLIRDGDADELLLYVDGALDDNLWNFQDPFSPDITNNTSIGGILRANPSHWFTGQIDDVAVFKSVLTEEEVTQLMNGELLEGEDPDADGDGILDSWEALYGVDDPDEDGDEDGLSNRDEFEKKQTNPTVADTDEDGLKDGVETGTGTFVDAGNTGTDPLNPDTDGDGIPDGVESNSGVFVSAADPGTSPLSKDTDMDGFNDKTEIDAGTNPVDAASFPAEEALLVAFWPLDEINGETTPDISGNGYDMVLNFMDEGNLVEGKVGNAMEFDGAETMLTRVHEDGEDLPIVQHESFSIALWVKGAYDEQAGNDMRVFSEGSDTGDRDPLYNIGTHNAGADATVDLFLRNGGSPNHQHSVLEAFDGEWHHIAFVHAGEEISLYVDGVLDEQVWTHWDTFKPGVTNDTTIGGILRDTPSHWFTGLIDEVGVWKSAISAATIQGLAAGESPGGASTVFQVTEVARGEGDITFTWTSKAGKFYAIDKSSDLQDWLEIEDGVEGEETATSFNLPEPGSEIYIRIREQQ